MHIALVGAGIGGLTAALQLRARGATTILLEQAESLGEAGAGLQLSPNATRILYGLGLGPTLERVACEPRAVEMFDGATGRPLMRLPLETARRRWGAPYLHVHRADLQQILLAALEGAEVRLGSRVASVEAEAGALQLESGETLVADAVIGCDGLRSAVRDAVLGKTEPRFTRQTAWRGLVAAHRLPAELRTPGARVWLGPARHFVTYPVRNGELVNFVGVVERPDWRVESWTERGDPAELARDFAGWAEPVRAVIDAAATAWRWALFDRPPLARWSFGRTSLSGDAAHPMLPFLAQGAAMAIEDAEALARHITGGAGAEAALKAYETERRDRTARVQALSRRNADLFHLAPLASRAMFGAAAALDRFDPSGGMRRFDWLYGYGYEGAAAPDQRKNHD